MKLFLVIVLLGVAAALFVAAAVLGAIPAAARLSNAGLACGAAAALAMQLPIP